MVSSNDPYVFDQIEVHGVPVHVKHWPNNPGCYFKVIFRVGSRHDPAGKEGLAHMFEHLPFNGCRGFEDSSLITEARDEFFYNDFGAYTGSDVTCFHGRVPDPSQAREATIFLRNFINNPLLDETEFKREVGVIEQEIWKDFVNQKQIDLAKELRRNIYRDHPMSRQARAYGWPDTVGELSRADCLSHHQQHYHRGNCEIILVGDVDLDDARMMVEPLVAEMPLGSKYVAPSKYPCFGPEQAERRISASRDLDSGKGRKVTEITFLRLIPLTCSRPVAFVAGAMLRQRLVRLVRQELGVTYSPSVNSRWYSDHAVVECQIKTAPAMADQVREIALSSIGWLSSDSIEASQVFDRKRRVELGRLKTAERTASGIASGAEDELTAFGEIFSLASEIAEFESLDQAEVAQFAKTELSPDKLFCTIIEP